MPHSTLRSLSVRLGGLARDNDWYRLHKADEVAAATERGLARAFQSADGTAASAGFDQAMAAYVADPFRGSQMRYVLAPGETCLGLELAAAQDALSAAGLEAAQIDLILVASWLPERFVAPGNAVFLARALGVEIPAWNVETACSSTLALLQIADGLVASGAYRRILVVASSTNSRQTDDTLGWISSDAAAAAVIEAPAGADGLLGAFMTNTAATCGVFEHALEALDGRGVVRMRVGAEGARALRETSGPGLVQRCCAAAAKIANIEIFDINYFGFSTPLAWFSAMCADALSVDRARTLDLFPRLANVGAPFPLVNLYHALAEQRARPGDLVMFYTVGSVSSAGAAVMRLGEVALGPAPCTVQR